MGRAFVFVIFVIGFVIFTVIKMVLAGTAAAYEAVFDPNAKDEKVKAVVAKCFMKVNVIMREKYSQQLNIGFKEAQLCKAILNLTPMVQSIILEHGYQANTEIAKDIVCHAILLGGHASGEEIDRAICLA